MHTYVHYSIKFLVKSTNVSNFNIQFHKICEILNRFAQFYQN